MVFSSLLSEKETEKTSVDRSRRGTSRRTLGQESSLSRSGPVTRPVTGYPDRVPIGPFDQTIDRGGGRTRGRRKKVETGSCVATPTPTRTELSGGERLNRDEGERRRYVSVRGSQNKGQ